jgi:hypothetical protein
MNRVDTPQTRCRAGVAFADITPPVGIYHRLWGAALHDRSTGVHRPLLATLLWLEPLEQANGRQLLIVALDHCLLDASEIERMRTAVSQAVPVAPEQIQVTMSHTHGAGWMSRTRASFPGGDLIGPYLDDLAVAIAGLARHVAGILQPATILYGQGRCNLAGQRDFWDAAHRQYVCGFNPDGPADDTVLVARLADEHDGTLGTLVNYACHPTTLAWDNSKLSPDFVGAMREVIEGHTQAPCVFLQGASGDLGPREGFVGDVSVADRNGRQLGFAALSALAALPPAGTRFAYTGPVVSGAIIGTWKHVPLDEETRYRQAEWHSERWMVDLPYRHDLPGLEETQQAHAHWQAEEARARETGDDARARDCRALVEQMTRRLGRLATLPPGKTFPYQVHLCRLGEARWLFVPGELYQTFQVTLRQRFADLPLVVTTLTGDWQPGYLPAANSYGYGIYQDVIATVGPGALEVLIESIARRIDQSGLR